MKHIIVTILLIIALISSAFPLFNVPVTVKASPTIIHVPADYSTISAAIANATSGDTILVSNGTYNEAVNIDKPLNITSVSGPGVTIIDGTGVSLASAGLVKITAAGNVTFSGFTVQHAPPDSSNVTIEILSQSSVAGVAYVISYDNIYGSNNVSNAQDYGFYSQHDSANVVFTHNYVTQTGCNNIVFEVHTGTTEISYNSLDAGVYGIDAIFMMTYDGYDVNNLQNVSYNTFNMGTGEAFDYDHRATAISFNTPGPAYSVGDAQFTNVLIQSNTINNLKSYGRGIGFWNGGGGGGGIIYPDVEDNVMTGTSANQSYGIDFIATGSSPIAALDATVMNNVISNTDYAIYLRTDGCAPGAQIYYNNIAGNTVGLDNTVGSSAVDTRYNWWGDPTGPYNATSNPSGTGNPVNGNVEYQPYQTSPVPTAFSFALYKTAIVKAADRLVALQSPNDHGWDWVVDGEPPWIGSSPKNLYGVTALGLVYAYEETGNSTYLTAAQNAAGYMISGAHPENGDFWNNGWGYDSDYVFLTQLSAASGNSSYATYALTAWTWQKANIPRYADGNQTQLWDNFANNWIGPGYYGAAAWECSNWGLAALEMDDTAWAGHMATNVIDANMGLIALPMTAPYLANNYTNDYVNMGMGSALRFLATLGGFASDVATLKNQLESNQLCDGSWDFQLTASPGESQTTAYVVMGLLTAGDYAVARKGADWLVSTQLPNGGWEGSPGEYAEIDSEAMQALTSSIVQLTVASAYDSPNPSGTTSYLVGTSVTASVTTSPWPGTPGTQYNCTGWTGTGDVPASGTGTTVTFTINQDSNITWNWQTQYYLTVETDPPSLVTIPGQGWYDNGIPRTLTAPPVTGYTFSHWDVDGTSQGSFVNPIIVNMNAPHNATAFYSVTPLMEVEPSTYTAKALNQTFTMNITLNNITPGLKLVGFEFKLSYNTTLLQIVSVKNGTFLESFAGPPNRGVLYYGPYYGSNYVLFAGFILPDVNGIWHAPFPSGNGTVATITFRVIYQPYGLQNPTNYCNLTLFDTKLADFQANPIPHGVQNGSYGIVPTPLGDLNFDGTVDIYDAIVFATSFGTRPSDLHWNPYADLNKDGIIDIYDAIIMGNHFGEKRPDP